MPANDYFKALELDAKQLMSLPDDQAAVKVERAYDQLMNAGHLRGSAHPRADLWETAKKTLCDPEARRYHAKALGYAEPDTRVPPTRPEPQDSQPPEPHWQPPKPHWQPPKPQPRRSESGEAGPWWMGGLLAMPAAILYMATSGLTVARTPQGSPLDAVALVVAILTAHFMGVRWLKIVFIGPFLLGLAWLLANLSIGAFARDVSSWSVAPEIGVLAVLTAFGVCLGLAGRVPATADITREYLGSTTFSFFIIALVLIPMVSLLIPTRGIPTPTDTATTETPREPDPGPTAQTEAELNLTRNEWHQIQAGLGVLGHYSGTVDGLPGPMTRTAITAWQRTQSGVATSFLNPGHAETLAALAPAPPLPAPPTGGRTPDRTREGASTSPAPAPAPETATRLVIRAEPESRITLDDEEHGFTSENGILRIDEVTPGGHVLSAEKDGFDTVTTTIEVTEGESQVVELVAKALPGRLTVTTNAANALVVIDGGEPRAVPVEDIEVESGPRLVTVAAPGYDTDQRYVDIAADRTTTHHATLEEASLEVEIAEIRQLFDNRSYEAAAAFAGSLAQTLVFWETLGIDVRENLAVALAFQGRALYALGNFAQSVQPLYNAVRFGEQIELPIKHRHGGGGFRQGFCTGSLVYSLDRITFRSTDDPDHGFAVEPGDISQIVAAEAQEGYLSRLNTEVEGRGSMDFVHPNSEQQRRDPDSALIIDIVCRNCNQALAVHEQMLRFLTRNTQ